MNTIVPTQLGSVGILNVGHGDTKISFDSNNPADRIRAARIVKDMLRRGYALLVEVEQTDGRKIFQRVYDFKEENYEYVIADLDPEIAAKQDSADEQAAETGTGAPAAEARGRGRPKLKRQSAATTRGVAIARTAGG